MPRGGSISNRWVGQFPTVASIEYLASGMTAEEILNDFPELTREVIRACLAFAADREKRLSASVA